jgi:hypothetical protein
MIETRRRAYLEALDIEVWLRKPESGPTAERNAGRLALEDGTGSVLLLCRDPGEKSTPVARDIGRLLGLVAVWGWPDPEPGPCGPTLAEAVDQRLLTRIVVFGSGLAERLFGGAAPTLVGSAAVAVAPDLDELALSGDCRRGLWRLVREFRSAGAR